MKLLRNPWFWCLWAALIAITLIWVAYRLNWPGTGFQGKTVWDWLSLLVIPAALALVALFFNQMNTSTERQIAAQRYEQDQQIAKQRYEQDQQITLDKQREDLLQAYFDRMSELLLEKGLRTSQTDDEVRNVARIRTISVLIQLDARRVGYVFTFLREAGLVNAPDPIISLADADLSKVKWERADLRRANLRGAYLFKASLSEASLSFANLSGASLLGADLDGAYLNGANLSGTILGGVYFGEAKLDGADLSGAVLFGADLSKASLSRTILGGVYLKDAKIDKSQLTPEQIAQAIWD